MARMNVMLGAQILALGGAMLAAGCYQGDAPEFLGIVDSGPGGSPDGGTVNNPPDAGPQPNTNSWGYCPAGGTVPHELWVTRQALNDVKIIDGPTFTLLTGPHDSIDLSPTGLKLPHTVTFNKNGTKAAMGMLGTPPLYKDGGFVIVDAETRIIERVVSLGRKTHSANFSPDGRTIVVANVNVASEGGGSIEFYDVATATITKKISTQLNMDPSGGTAVQSAFNRDGTKVYVTSGAFPTGHLFVVDVASQSLDGAPYNTGGQTIDVVLTNDYKTAFVTNAMGASVQKIDLTASDRTMAVKDFATMLPDAHTLGIGIDKLIVSVRLEARYAVYDMSGNLIKSIPIMATSGNALVDWFAMSPDCAFAYVTERADGNVQKIDMNSLTVVNQINLKLNSMAYNVHGTAVRRPYPFQ